MRKFPSLPEMLSVVHDWWKEIEHGWESYEIPIKRVAEFLIKKNITQEWEKAKAIIYKGQFDWSTKRPIVN